MRSQGWGCHDRVSGCMKRNTSKVSSSFFLPCEDIVRSGPSASQEARPDQGTQPAGMLCLDFPSLQNHDDKILLFWASGL